MKQADVEAWFGDRGIPLSPEQKKYSIIRSTSNLHVCDDQWIFISDRYQLPIDHNGIHYVELYYMNTDCAEVYNDWPEVGFDWSSHNLFSLLPQENDT